MSDTNPVPTEREEIEMLLPWYVTGKLDRGDTERVAAYLAAHPEMAAQLDLIRQELSETIAVNEAIEAPSQRSFEALMGQIANDDRVSGGNFLRGLITQVSELLAAPSPGAVKWAAAAVAVVVVVQAAAITTMMVQEHGPKTYQSASGGQDQSAATGTFALVQFNGNARAAEIATQLAELKLAIVDGPKPGGLYKIRLDAKKLTDAERDERIRALAARPAIFSLVTASN